VSSPFPTPTFPTAGTERVLSSAVPRVLPGCAVSSLFELCVSPRQALDHIMSLLGEN